MLLFFYLFLLFLDLINVIQTIPVVYAYLALHSKIGKLFQDPCHWYSDHTRGLRLSFCTL